MSISAAYLPDCGSTIVHSGGAGAGGVERVLTEGFTRFMLHYRFQADFCNPAVGNEKGNVENKVGYSRRNAFVPIPTITSFDAFNEWLWERCEKDAQRLHYKYKGNTAQRACKVGQVDVK